MKNVFLHNVLLLVATTNIPTTTTTTATSTTNTTTINTTITATTTFSHIILLTDYDLSLNAINDQQLKKKKLSKFYISYFGFSSSLSSSTSSSCSMTF